MELSRFGAYISLTILILLSLFYVLVGYYYVLDNIRLWDIIAAFIGFYGAVFFVFINPGIIIWKYLKENKN